MRQFGIGFGRTPKPLELVAGLDEIVVGHDTAKRALALTAYLHYLGVASPADGPGPAFVKQHVLLLGPTGFGKTQFVRELARLLGVPVAIVSATSYVEAGYVGEKVETIIRKLFCDTGGVVGATERRHEIRQQPSGTACSAPRMPSAPN